MAQRVHSGNLDSVTGVRDGGQNHIHHHPFFSSYRNLFPSLLVYGGWEVLTSLLTPKISIDPRPGQSAHFIAPGPQDCFRDGYVTYVSPGTMSNISWKLLEPHEKSLPENEPSQWKVELSKGKRPGLKEPWI